MKKLKLPNQSLELLRLQSLNFFLMDFISQNIKVAYLNCRGQTGLNLAKQLQIENFLQTNDIDVAHLQETHFDDETFMECRFISSSYYLIRNNSESRYGTGSLIRNSFQADEIVLHHSGRIILFNIADVTLGIYTSLVELMGQVEQVVKPFVVKLLQHFLQPARVVA